MSESFAKLVKLTNLVDFVKANSVDLAGFTKANLVNLLNFVKLNLADFAKANLVGFAINFARANLAINSAANSLRKFTAKCKTFTSRIHSKTQNFQANLHAKFTTKHKFTATHENSSLSLSLVKQNA